MKGADQCPKCGSRKWIDGEQQVTGFYARVLRICGNCATSWEPFDAADLIDCDDRYSSFKEPCNNCAFRPGSNEQQDKERWHNLMEQLAGWPTGRFYCHKGVPLDLHHQTPTDSGFCYPTRSVTAEIDGQAVTKELPDERRLRLCRGFLKMWGAQMDKAQRKVKA